jgi:signal transduction histidine kinase
MIVRAREKARAREVQRKHDIEHAKAEERERMRRKSSADFHDEAGHLLTKITLFLELAKRKSTGDRQLGDHLSKIEEHTKALSTGMRDFIWGLDPEKDSLNDTLVRLLDFGNQMFESSPIRFEGKGIVPLPEDIPLSMDVRRSVVFIFKEAMNNCLKYSRASEIQFQSEQDGEDIILTLVDNGVGFKHNESGNGYGLRNMKTRAEKVGGALHVNSEPGRGTVVRLVLRPGKPINE